MENTIPLFYDAYGNEINIMKSEREEQVLAFKYVPVDSCGVLELGARYGTVTSAISKKIKQRPVLISVEPDVIVWKAFQENMTRNHVNTIFLPGVISRKPQVLIQMDYGSYTVDAEKEEEEIKLAQQRYNIDVAKGWLNPYTIRTNKNFHCVTLEKLLEDAKIPKIDTLVADCEGFLETFLNENPNLYTDLKVLIFEGDGESRSNYEAVETKLLAHGFRQEVKGFQNVWLKDSNL